MAAAATVAFNATITGLPTGTKSVTIPSVVPTPIDGSTVVALVSGANTITPPVGATVACIVPPVANATTITLKGVTGDTGVPLSPTNPSWVSLASAAAFCLTSGVAGVTVEILYL